MNDLLLKDFVDRRAMERIQLERMQDTLRRVYDNVAFYRRAFDAAGVKPEDLRSLADLCKFPFTEKTDLRDHYPFGLLATDQKNVVRIHASSGTTGKPTVVCYTHDDIQIWSETMCRTLQLGGCTEHDIVQNSYGYGLFTGGLGAHYGAERLGCSVIPMGGGATEKQLLLIRDFGTTAICCTPSFFIHMIEEAEKIGMDFRQTKLRIGFFGAEPWTDAMRRLIEEKSGIKAFDIFGLSEVIGPGVSADCEAHCGLHVFEDHYYPEIVDSVTGEVLPPGEEGELVFTTITKQAMPVIRYRTHDISRLNYEKCACGRTIVRMDKVQRRSDDMLIIRGVNLFPSQVESVLLTVKGVEPHYQLVVTREGAMDELEIRVEVTQQIFSDAVGGLEMLRERISSRIKEIIGLSAKITLVEPGTIERSMGKARRVQDLRKLK
ncbi:phenylacetate--CoA ligase family protein [Oligosphaera ethanolica]|uniref:Phenylacetate-coenzyme A ligase n=1 Tax=Oligosphaera ethanolica TaxID=760260 RepID=A0AAE4ANR9_9BACT|nr:phenylacetate--CoA ligase [Oligosphaera ethanolica]MDQ0288642.1 phenylacetate-CoA ligase [Oligosphaera ethanolica]